MKKKIFNIIFIIIFVISLIFLGFNGTKYFQIVEQELNGETISNFYDEIEYKEKTTIFLTIAISLMLTILIFNSKTFKLAAKHVFNINAIFTAIYTILLPFFIFWVEFPIEIIITDIIMLILVLIYSLFLSKYVNEIFDVFKPIIEIIIILFLLSKIVNIVWTWTNSFFIILALVVLIAICKMIERKNKTENKTENNIKKDNLIKSVDNVLSKLARAIIVLVFLEPIVISGLYSNNLILILIFLALIIYLIVAIIRKIIKIKKGKEAKIEKVDNKNAMWLAIILILVILIISGTIDALKDWERKRTYQEELQTFMEEPTYNIFNEPSYVQYRSIYPTTKYILDSIRDATTFNNKVLSETDIEIENLKKYEKLSIILLGINLIY